MTSLNSSQLATINVLGGVSGGIAASQLSAIVVASAPVALGVNASQLFGIVVVANGQYYQPMGPVRQLNCWTPCGVLMYNGV